MEKEIIIKKRTNAPLVLFFGPDRIMTATVVWQLSGHSVDDIMYVCQVVSTALMAIHC